MSVKTWAIFFTFSIDWNVRSLKIRTNFSFHVLISLYITIDARNTGSDVYEHSKPKTKVVGEVKTG